MIYYELFVGRGYDSAYGYYEAYGITASRSGEVIRTIEDISPDITKINALVRLYNEEHLSLNQLDEAIEDFLYDFEV